MSGPVQRKAFCVDSFERDVQFMRAALELARKGEEVDEIPVGAVVVLDGEIVGRGSNSSIRSKDPTAHAEIVAMRMASECLGNYRVEGATLFSTLEPCVMCAGAIVVARVQRLVFGARDLRFGAVRSKFALADSELLNHRVQIEEGLLAAECGELLRNFLQRARSRGRSVRSTGTGKARIKQQWS